MSDGGGRGFWFVWGFDALIATIVLFFFFSGLADGRVRAFNVGAWLILLLVVGGVVGGSLKLRATGRTGTAMKLLMVLAVPGFLGVLFLLIVAIGRPRWN